MQLSYATNMAIGFPGMLADAGENDILSRAATAFTPFGCAVVRGSNDENCALPAASGDIVKIMGVALESKATVNQIGQANAGYPQYGAVSVLHKGRVYVQAEEAVAPGDPVFVRISTTYATGTGFGLGAFGKTAGTAERSQLSDGSQGSKAKWMTTAVAGGIAVLEVNF